MQISLIPGKQGEKAERIGGCYLMERNQENHFFSQFHGPLLPSAFAIGA